MEATLPHGLYKSEEETDAEFLARLKKIDTSKFSANQRKYYEALVARASGIDMEVRMRHEEIDRPATPPH